MHSDWQAFYEAPATRDVIAQSVFEFGRGTGAFDERFDDGAPRPNQASSLRRAFRRL